MKPATTHFTQLVLTVVSIISVTSCATKPEVARADIEQAYPGHQLRMRFEGHYPCGITNAAETCDRLKVWLFLYSDAQTSRPSRYNFGYIAVGGGNDARNIREGNWEFRTGRPSFPNAEIIVLDETTPEIFREHWLVDDHLLLLMTEDGRVRPGHPGGGYTLYNYTLQRISVANL